ncbi:MAG TPA: hypothetical protein VEJ67_01090 [Candidatus Cybelea sp.]|nr:hypothetical protein [Candidatus Cybelea sp.]
MRRAAAKTVIAFLVAILLPVLNAQTARQPQSSPSAPAVEPSDAASPDAIIAAVYDVISGPAGKKRDWDRFRSLFASGARLIPVVSSSQGAFRAVAMSPDEYATRGTPYFERNGFYEREIARKTERWGFIVEAFSTYESRHNRSDPTPFERGINSFQLFFDGSRWWIVTIMWQSETPSNPLAPDFLPPPGK